MKTSTFLVIALSMFGALGSLSAAEEKPPTFRQTAEWIIVSGNAADGGQRGPLPWTYAIRKSAVVSMCIETDIYAADQLNGGKDKKFHEATAEEIQAAPALIVITTTEVQGGGNFKYYCVRGLTHATAPAMLEKMLEAMTPAEVKKSAG